MMKSRQKIGLVFIILTALILISVYIYRTSILRGALPDYEVDMPVKALKETVKVYRDDAGVPHIYANNEHDLYVTTGYIMAQERLWQMDLLRRVTLGRLSEIFGDNMLKTDVLLRALDFGRKSTELIETMQEDELKCIQAFAEGVNAYIDDNIDNLPLEFSLLSYEPERWEVQHTLNLISYMAWDLKAGWFLPLIDRFKSELDSAHLADILPNLSAHKTTVYEGLDNAALPNMLSDLYPLEEMGLDVLYGSNNWVVSGEKSETGMPLLANDMHLMHALPGIWVQMHQVVEGKLNVTGLAMPGAPVIVVGHNDSIAWGMTNTYVDNIDFYEEKINPDDSNTYLLDSNWVPFTYRNEEIKNSDGEIHHRTIKFTHRGAVISDFKNTNNRVVSIKWIGSVESNEYRSIYRVNRANNWEDFKQSFKSFASISQNIAYADKEGNIGLYTCAGVPVRKRDLNLTILPGWTSEYDWQGIIPFEELPHAYNPASGMLSSANNKTVDDSYPYYICSWYSLPYRIDRIREMLASEQLHSVESFKAMQNDYTSKMAQMLQQFAIEHMDTTKLSDFELMIWQMYSQWNCVMDKEMASPHVNEYLAYVLVKKCLKDELSEKLSRQALKLKKI
ncbi:MAG: penicillin acylase family protein, partial [Bacteroidales bacterium]|nr:penicillin acylase family protein [Bacteroidales bacterium]